jgi:hypothetical protein
MAVPGSRPVLADLPVDDFFHHAPTCRPRRRNSSKENCHGTEPPPRRSVAPCHAAPAGRHAAALARCGPARRRRQVHRDGLDHLHRAVGPVRPPAAGSSRQATGIDVRWWRWAPARRWTWAAAATPTWCSCTTRWPREVRRRRLRPRAPAGDVQRLRAHRPQADPAATKGKDITAALQKLAAANGNFVSRGDKSGTHAAELRYWKAAGHRHRRRQAGRATRNAAAAWARR